MYTEQSTSSNVAAGVLMDLSDLFGTAIRTYPDKYSSDDYLCKTIRWADAALAVAYASGSIEIDDPSEVVKLQKYALQLRYEAVRLSNQKKCSDTVYPVASLHLMQTRVAHSLRVLFEAVNPSIIPYFDSVVVA